MEKRYVVLSQKVRGGGGEDFKVYEGRRLILVRRVKRESDET